MNDISFEPDNFYLRLLKAYSFYFALYLIILFFQYLFISESIRTRMFNIQLELPEISIFVLFFLTLIILIYLNKIYIYNVYVKDDKIIIKYQKFNKHSELELNISDTNIEIKTSGRGRILFKLSSKLYMRDITLKQNTMDGWKDDTIINFVNDYNSYKKYLENNSEK